MRGPVRYSATGLSSPGTSPTNGSGSFWSLVAACRNAYGDYRELQRSVFRRRVWCSFDMGARFTRRNEFEQSFLREPADRER